MGSIDDFAFVIPASRFYDPKKGSYQSDHPDNENRNVWQRQIAYKTEAGKKELARQLLEIQTVCTLENMNEWKELYPFNLLYCDYVEVVWAENPLGKEDDLLGVI